MTDADFVNTIVKKTLHSEIKPHSLIYHGINSRIYRIVAPNHKIYKVKYYLKKEYDRHNSIITEYNSLSFLWKEGIRIINRPISIFPKYRIAIYGYLPGTSMNRNEIKRKDVDQLLQFMKNLALLSKKKTARELEFAKEACFSLNSYIANCDKKLKIIRKASRNNPNIHLLDQFLGNGFIPLYEAIKSYAVSEYRKRDMDYTSRLPFSLRTLNPSDFGFHNCLRYSSDIYFLDFEYFGWDDPAKMIADALLRPRGNIPFSYQKYFCRQAISFFPNDTTLRIRLSLFYYLLACKWSLILLNSWTRTDPLIDKNEQLIQLKKSQTLLRHIQKQYVQKELSFLPYEITAT